MLKSRWLAVAGIAVLSMAFVGGAKPRWTKFSKAKAYAAKTGLPICVYSTVSPDGGGC